jgi:lipid-binding SYLF domain-containing protein
MKNRLSIASIPALCLILATSVVSWGQKKASGDLKDMAEEAAKAAETLREIMGIPEKSIPHNIFDSAECVAVFPSTIKGGFIIGARKGEGVLSCRTPDGWSAPVFLDLSGGSVGAQIGAQATDYVLLFMNRSGVDKLLSNKLTLGGEASVAAGPVGREAGASTDWKMNAQILSYSRSKGLFAGVELKGVVISIDDSDMRVAYGEGPNPKGILLKSWKTAPPEVQTFPKELARFSARSASHSKK